MASQDYLKIHRIFNTLVGLPIYVKDENYFYKSYQYISEVIVLLGVLGQFMAVPYIWDDMNVLCGCLASGTHSAQVLANTILLKIQKQKQINYIIQVNQVQQRVDVFKEKYLKFNIPDFFDFHKVQSKYVRILLMTQFFMTILSTSAYFLPFVYDAIVNSDEVNSQHTPIVVYLHFDYNKTPYFQIITVFLTVCFYLNNLKTVVIDNFLLGLIVLQTSQLKFHKSLLEKRLERLKGIQGELKYEDKIFIREWLIHHQEIVKVATCFKNLMSSYLLLEFAYVLIHTCVPAFVITSTFSWTLAQKMAVFFIVGGGLLELYLMCRAGDDFTEAYEMTGNPLFGMNLLHPKEKWLRYVFSMIKSKLRRPVKLTAYTIIPLSCGTFLAISRLIVSYYMTLNEIQGLKQGKI